LVINVLDADFRIDIWSASTQTAQRAHKSIVTTGVGLYREEDTTRVVKSSASFAFNGWIIDEVWRAAAAYAARIIYPILVDILAKSKFRSSSLLDPNSWRLTSEDTMQTSKVETV
jgi:hypothetical protein